MNARQRFSSSLSFIFRAASLILLLTLVSLTHAVAQSPQSVQSSSPTLSDLQARAQRGDSFDQYRLGKYLLTHNPSPAGVQSALTLLHDAAAQNQPDALFYLGYLYEHGQFVSRDYALALQNYQAAAKLHYFPAENNLASLYQHGRGVHKNLSMAFDLYLDAAQQGDRVAQGNLASLYYLGSGTPRDISQAVRWFRASADAGLPESQNDLAYLYYHGIGVQRDTSEAVHLILLAAQQGFSLAETNLAFLYEHGKGLPLDYVAAYSWYTRAINAGDSTGVADRKALAHLMTRKQLDEASALTTTASTQIPSTLPPSPSAFSLLSH